MASDEKKRKQSRYVDLYKIFELLLRLLEIIVRWYSKMSTYLQKKTGMHLPPFSLPLTPDFYCFYIYYNIK
ncbi:hypothetical protein PQ744_09865 [Thermoanaerobacterium thermosaccharolyticum]|uniref:hypothetical protein n=2 Tax=Thermoanaerobacterium thermosaccharolyticum TaxID=1517 RepID=UPI003D2A774C